MPNLTTPIPPTLAENSQTALKQIKDWGTALIDELTFILNNLDTGNVTEAASVKAENIDISNGKILNAQIKNLTADKITAGTINLSRGITVKNATSDLEITSDLISISENGALRIAMGKDSNGKFIFMLTDGNGNGMLLDESGEATFSGTINTQKDIKIGRILEMCNYNNEGFILFGDNASIKGDKSTDTLKIEAMNGIKLHSSGGVAITTSGNNPLTINGSDAVTVPQMENYVKQYVAWALSQL